MMMSLDASLTDGVAEGFTERSVADLRAETTTTNLTNTLAFATPNVTVGSADFSKITSTRNGLIANQSVGGMGPRSLTFALRIRF